MGRLITIAEIKQRALRRADMENSQFIASDELMQLVNEAYTELYDLLVQAFEHYYVSTYSFTTSANVQDYTLPSDFYKLISLESQINSVQWQTLYPFKELEKNATVATTGAIQPMNLKLTYVPMPQQFVADTDTADCQAGWESLWITDVAMMMLEKEESNTTELEARRQREYKRIQEMSHNRDTLMPGRITDVTVYDTAYIRDSVRYRLYGNALKLINVQFTGF